MLSPGTGRGPRQQGLRVVVGAVQGGQALRPAPRRAGARCRAGRSADARNDQDLAQTLFPWCLILQPAGPRCFLDPDWRLPCCPPTGSLTYPSCSPAISTPNLSCACAGDADRPRPCAILPTTPFAIPANGVFAFAHRDNDLVASAPAKAIAPCNRLTLTPPCRTA